MKISILTFSKEFNYGANLQCFALCKTLLKLGHHVNIIDVQLSPLPASIITKIMRIPESISFYFFRKNHLPPFTRKFNNLQELCNNCPDSDAFIVGSDQVWNPNITKRLDPLVYFLPFVPPSAKRIAYAASMAVDKWNFPELTPAIHNELLKFDAISVREEESKKICKIHFGVDVQTVLDPTLLLDNYDEIIGSYKKEKETNDLILFKFLSDKDCNEICLKIAKEKHYTPIYLARRHLEKGFKFYPNVSIHDWLNKIRYAKFIVTDSFHCMVFCILFKKSFVVLPSFKGRSGRMKNLLSRLGIADRFCEDMNDLNNRINLLLNTPIDFDLVGSVIEREKMKSVNFLTNALNG